MEARGVEELVSQVTDGFFARRLGKSRFSGVAAWLDALLDSLDWESTRRRDNAARALVELAGFGGEPARRRIQPTPPVHGPHCPGAASIPSRESRVVRPTRQRRPRSVTCRGVGRKTRR